MSRINDFAFREDLRPILSSAVGTDYSHYLLYDGGFFDAVKQNVEETSAWSDEGYYTDDDIRLAIGRVIMDKFGVEY